MAFTFPDKPQRDLVPQELTSSNQFGPGISVVDGVLNPAGPRTGVVRDATALGLQGALNAANYGDDVVLAAGSTYLGQIQIPNTNDAAKAVSSTTPRLLPAPAQTWSAVDGILHRALPTVKTTKSSVKPTVSAVKATTQARGAGHTYIRVMSSGYALLPVTRVGLTHAANLATIQANGSLGQTFAAVVTTLGGGAGDANANPCHHYRFEGIYFRPRSGIDDFALFDCSGSATPFDKRLYPHHLIFDRCVFNGNVTGSIATNRSGTWNGGWLAWLRTTFLNFWNTALESQAIHWNVNIGPDHVEDCRLQSQSENFMSGGAPVNNSDATYQGPDVTMRRCWFEKPQSWNPNDPTWDGINRGSDKNLLEFKHGLRVWITGCVFSYSWAGAQNGYMFVYIPTSQGGSQPATVKEVTMDYCRADHVGLFSSGDQRNDNTQLILMSPTHVLFRNNLITGMGDPALQASAGNISNQTGERIMFDHNTLIHVNPSASVLVTGRSPGGVGTLTDAFYYWNNVAVGGNAIFSTDSSGNDDQTLTLRGVPQENVDRNVFFSGGSFSSVVTNGRLRGNTVLNSRQFANVGLSDETRVGFPSYTGQTTGNYALQPVYTTDSAACTVTVLPAVSLTETFTAADSPGSLTADNPWVVSAGWGIVSNRAKLTNSTAALRFGRCDTTLGSPDQDVSCTLSTFTRSSSTLMGGVMARQDASGTPNCYMWFGYNDGTTNKYVLQKMVAGTQVHIQTYDAGPAPAPGDVLRLVVTGTTLTTYLNGGVAFSVTDSSVTAGNFAGVMGQATGASDIVELDTWAASFPGSSTVTVSSGTIPTTVQKGTLFRVSTDAASNLVAVRTRDSGTQCTLAGPYTGATGSGRTGVFTFQGSGNDGLDPGADIPTLLTRTSGVDTVV